MKESVKLTAALLLVTAAAACDKVPLLAPSNSTITLSASARVLPVGGTTGLTAFVTESSGTSVQNGTTVRFTTTLGSVDPAETQTTNGIAVATFRAGSSSGVAEVRAISGGATGGTGSGTGTGSGSTSGTNVVTITIGSAAVNTITLRANPSSVGPNGGPVELVATVVGESGNGLQGIPVTFNADQGVLSAQTVATDAGGEARTVLTTSQKTSVTATAGTKTSTAVTVDVRVGPGISITCAPATGAGSNCASVQATSSNNTATVVFTVTKGTGTSTLRDVTINFGDGTSQSLGTLGGGSATVTHTYDGPSGSSPRSFTATARATDLNNETSSASTTVTVNPRAQLTVDLSVSQEAAVPGVGRTANFTATVTGGDPVKFEWDFGDGTTATTSANKTSHVYRANGQFTATVTVTTTDGRTGTGRVEFIVSGI